MTHTLVVRLDNAGDVLLAGPAVRAVAAHSSRVTLLAGPRGAAAASLLPGVDEVLVWPCPWIDAGRPPVTRDDVSAIVARLSELRADRALVFTSFHQSALPTALLLRLAGVPWIGAVSDDYPGALLDLRHRLDDDVPEARRALSLAAAAGCDLPADDDGRLRVTSALPDVTGLLPPGDFVVVHPGTSVPARAWPAEHHAAVVRLLTARGHRVVVTGGQDETALTARVAAGAADDLGGRTDLASLAAVLGRSRCVVAGNTGPAHLAAAVGTPVVSLFAPTVPAVRWAPYGVRTILLGDQDAACRGSRATTCPVPGHPCLASVGPDEVLHAVERLVGTPTRVPVTVAGPPREEQA